MIEVVRKKASDQMIEVVRMKFKLQIRTLSLLLILGCSGVS